jgi:hypothetical protein
MSQRTRTIRILRDVKVVGNKQNVVPAELCCREVAPGEIQNGFISRIDL